MIYHVDDMPNPEPGRCPAKVYKPDCYRRTGRGKGGFEMHYTAHQCKRKTKDGERCWQHREDGT